MSEGTNEQMLDHLQKETFEFFLKQVDPVTGLLVDKTAPQSPASTAVVGMGLTAYIVGVERGLLPRGEAVARTLRVLRFLASSEQSESPGATGYRGFYYHFLDMGTGRRSGGCELSTIDTALLMAGILSVGAYFVGADADEAEIRSLSVNLYRRVDWVWALDGQSSIGHGWTPEHGFIPHRWDRGYSEAMLLYVLALGSPTFPIDGEGYRAWTSTFEWRSVDGVAYAYAGPLFIHQFSQMWLDARGIRDDFNRRVGIDYFENSRRATYVHRNHAVKNPGGFAHYGANCWGLTASDGPGPAERTVDGVVRKFEGYLARGAPDGPDDGTVSPWAVVASLPFAPEIVQDTIRHAIERLGLKGARLPGFDASFNPTFPEKSSNPNGWVSPWRFGLNQGPIVTMIENHRSGLIWANFKRIPWVVTGLRRAGFQGGWLEDHGQFDGPAGELG